MTIKRIVDMRLFERNSGLSILDHISEEPIADKEKVFEYLMSGIADGVRCSHIYDYVKGHGNSS